MLYIFPIASKYRFVLRGSCNGLLEVFLNEQAGEVRIYTSESKAFQLHVDGWYKQQESEHEENHYKR